MDYRTDNNPRGIQMLQQQLGDRLPDFVKGASAQEAEEKPKKFAHFVRGEYPYDTPAQTWMSYAYLKTAGASLPVDTQDWIERVLVAAGRHHEIESDLCEIDMVLTQAHEKQASAEADEGAPEYALVVERDGARTHLFPVRTPNQVRKSANAVHRDLELPIEWRKMASETIVDAARRHGVDLDTLPDSISIYGISREPNFKVASEVAEYRAGLVDDPEIGQLYRDIVKSASHDRDEAVDQYIGLMLDLDRAQGLDKRYGRGVVDPYRAFRSGPETETIEKTARENVLLLDTLVPTEVFHTLREHVHSVFSKKAADNLRTIFEGDDGTQISAAIAKLPLKTQRQLMELAIEKG
jgi:hypothetical protein